MGSVTPSYWRGHFRCLLCSVLAERVASFRVLRLVDWVPTCRLRLLNIVVKTSRYSLRSRSSDSASNEEFSLPLNVVRGATTRVEFRVGCDVINGGTVVVSTDPSPVRGEPARKAANNDLTQTFGNECLVS
jgi:hypothetical protein